MSKSNVKINTTELNGKIIVNAKKRVKKEGKIVYIEMGNYVLFNGSVYKGTSVIVENIIDGVYYGSQSSYMIRNIELAVGHCSGRADVPKYLADMCKKHPIKN